MALNYTEQQAEELLCVMYDEITELREALGKNFLYRDHFAESLILDLLERGIFEPKEADLMDLYITEGSGKLYSCFS